MHDEVVCEDRARDRGRVSQLFAGGVRKYFDGGDLHRQHVRPWQRRFGGSTERRCDSGLRSALQPGRRRGWTRSSIQASLSALLPQ
jgi:hypothetical protein